MTSGSSRHVFHRYGAGVNLKQARKAKRLTILALATKVGISDRTVNRCERQNRLPQNRLSRERYCRILGIKAR